MYELDYTFSHVICFLQSVKTLYSNINMLSVYCFISVKLHYIQPSYIDQYYGTSLEVNSYMDLNMRTDFSFLVELAL